MNDKIRFGIIAFINSVLPALMLLNLINWNEDQIASVMFAVSQGVSLLALIFPQGQAKA